MRPRIQLCSISLPLSPSPPLSLSPSFFLSFSFSTVVSHRSCWRPPPPPPPPPLPPPLFPETLFHAIITLSFSRFLPFLIYNRTNPARTDGLKGIGGNSLGEIEFLISEIGDWRIGYPVLDSCLLISSVSNCWSSWKELERWLFQILIFHLCTFSPRKIRAWIPSDKCEARKAKMIYIQNNRFTGGFVRVCVTTDGEADLYSYVRFCQYISFSATTGGLLFCIIFDLEIN